MRDIKTFSDTFYANSNKIVQDSILLKFCSIGSAQRIRNPLSTRNRSVAISCFVRTENKGLLPVCKAAFLGILNISKHRIDGLMKRFFTKISFQ
nr:unnamed protein product [Callosobruchus chinensis]